MNVMFFVDNIDTKCQCIGIHPFLHLVLHCNAEQEALTVKKIVEN